METFASVYTDELTRAVLVCPDEYSYDLRDVPEVVARMVPRLARGATNKDSVAIRRTCKRLGIPHTIAAIRERLAAEKGR